MGTRTGGTAGPRSAGRGYWRAQIEAQRGSGLSQVAFCARHGLRTGTLRFWKWKLRQEAGAVAGGRRRAGSRSVPAPAFVPIQLTAAARPRPAAGVVAPDGEIEIALGADRSVRVRGRVDPAWLVQVLRGLEGAAC